MISTGDLASGPLVRFAVDRHGVARLTDPVSASWARITPKTHNTYRMRQFGPRRLWDEVEAVHRWWERNSKSGIEDRAWVVAQDRQSVSLP